jgi:hypothetical protein
MSHHAWGTWSRTGALYDSLGGYIGPTHQEFHGGTPVTGGWSRTCRVCGTTEASPASLGLHTPASTERGN